MKYLSCCAASTCLALALSGGIAAADTVIVNSTIPVDVPGVSYQTITDALNYVKTTAEPREVDIVGGGPYTENMAINFSVTVRGLNYKPVIVTPPTAGVQNASLNGNGVVFFTTADFPGDQTFRLENLTILPQVGNPPTRGIRTNNNNSTDQLTPVKMKVELVDVLITSNNGSDAPVSTDGLSKADLSGATSFKDDIMYFAGYVDVNTTRTVITNSFGGAIAAASVDGIIYWPDAPDYTLTLGPGTVISYMNRMAIQMVASGAALNAVGTESDPVVFKGNFQNYATRNSAISFFNDDAGTGKSNIFKHVVFVENNSRSIGVSLIDDNETALGMEAENVAFVNNKESNIVIADGMTNDWNFTSCTIVGTQPAGGELSIITLTEGQAGFNTGAVNFVDSIIAGNGTADSSNVISVSAPNMPVTFTNSAIPTSGPYAVGNGTSIYNLGAGVTAPFEVAVQSADPEFQLVSDAFKDPNFLDVAAPSYAGAASGGANLSGYGDYVGTSSVNDWAIY